MEIRTPNMASKTFSLEDLGEIALAQIFMAAKYMGIWRYGPLHIGHQPQPQPLNTQPPLARRWRPLAATLKKPRSKDAKINLQSNSLFSSATNCIVTWRWSLFLLDQTKKGWLEAQGLEWGGCWCRNTRPRCLEVVHIYFLYRLITYGSGQGSVWEWRRTLKSLFLISFAWCVVPNQRSLLKWIPEKALYSGWSFFSGYHFLACWWKSSKICFGT